MQKDFHYDIIYALAKAAGYTDSEANIIAYASQYVDDNTDREYSAFDSHGEFYVGFPDEIGKSGDYISLSSLRQLISRLLNCLSSDMFLLLFILFQGITMWKSTAKRTHSAQQGDVRML